jgi:hypothetical protein
MTHPGRLAVSSGLFVVIMGYIAWRTEAALRARAALMRGDYSDPGTRRLVRGFALLTSGTLLAPAWVDGLRPSGLIFAAPIALLFSLVEAAYHWNWPRFTAQRAFGAILVVAALLPSDDAMFRVMLACFGLLMLSVPGAFAALDIGLGSRGEILYTRTIAVAATVVSSGVTLFLAYQALSR